MRIARNEFLEGRSGRVSGRAVAALLHALAEQAPPGARGRISRLIQDYDAQGIHRTGTEVDDASGAWLQEQARAAGAVAALERFRLARVEVQTCTVTVGGRTIAGLPLFDGGFTPPKG